MVKLLCVASTTRPYTHGLIKRLPPVTDVCIKTNHILIFPLMMIMSTIHHCLLTESKLLREYVHVVVLAYQLYNLACISICTACELIVLTMQV